MYRVRESACILPHCATTQTLYRRETSAREKANCSFCKVFHENYYLEKEFKSLGHFFSASKHGPGKGVNFTSSLRGKNPISEDLEKILAHAPLSLHDFVLHTKFLSLSASQL